MKTYIYIILFLFDQPGQCVLFDNPTIIKDKSGNSILECWGAALHDGVWLLDEDNNWHELTEDDQNADVVIETIWERLSVKKEKAA